MRFIKLIHKWTSLFVGIQLLLWLVSGFYFNIMDHDKVRGNQYREQLKLAPVVYSNMNNAPFIDPKTILAEFENSQSLTIVSVLDKPYYLLTHQTGLYHHFYNKQSLVNTFTGKEVIVDQEMASKIAKTSYNGPGTIQSVTLQKPPIEDIPKEKNTVWQINFKDNVNTSVYVNASSGRLIKHSDDDKRIADFFFMLHFMDYAGEGSFNNWQIIFFSIITLWLVLSGFIWTIELGFKGQYKFSFVMNKSKNLGIKNLPVSHATKK
ncbi:MULTISPECIES: PepSY domain-containing protein [unclassified Pseudoalteromonas]|uniref:PepSY domain-containing protein n=1 Tax=unclassified Pseudoalteromonas TaxID=194690 RepID=UPI000A9C4790|nr:MULTISPECIES: PepSY domain-containing protein [unclassified Pseudoalteromonas]